MSSRDRFVPRRVGQIMAHLEEVPWDRPSDVADFGTFARLVSALLHFDYYDREQSVLGAWEEVEDDPEAADTVRRELTRLLVDANYGELTVEELSEALARESLIPLRLEVDLDDYEDLVIYRRSSQPEEVEVRRWRGLRTARRSITVEGRVVVLTRVKPASWFRDRGIDPAARNLVPGHVSLKQFQNVPRADIEMLLPSTQVRYRPVDALLVGLPALASGIAVLATKLLPTIGLMVVLFGAWIGLRDEQPQIDQGALVILFGGLITLGSFLVRQWAKLKNRRLGYLKTLTETLYFRTLADGPGVLHTLLSVAEEQDAIEVLLAYRFLLAAPEGRSAGQLDEDVERWLRAACRLEVDFDVEHALEKLRALDVLAEDGPHFRARPLGQALARLEHRWDAVLRPGAPVPDVATAGR